MNYMQTQPEKLKSLESIEGQKYKKIEFKPTQKIQAELNILKENTRKSEEQPKEPMKLGQLLTKILDIVDNKTETNPELHEALCHALLQTAHKAYEDDSLIQYDILSEVKNALEVLKKQWAGSDHELEIVYSEINHEIKAYQENMQQFSDPLKKLEVNVISEGGLKAHENITIQNSVELSNVNQMVTSLNLCATAQQVEESSVINQMHSLSINPQNLVKPSDEEEKTSNNQEKNDQNQPQDFKSFLAQQKSSSSKQQEYKL